MAGRESGRGRRSTEKHFCPRVEGLDQPGFCSQPRWTGARLVPRRVDIHSQGSWHVRHRGPGTAVSSFLATQLGSDFSTIPGVPVSGAPTSNAVASQVLNQTFIRQVLSRQDTFSLLGTAVTDWGGAGNTYSSTGPLSNRRLLPRPSSRGLTRPGGCPWFTSHRGPGTKSLLRRLRGPGRDSDVSHRR